MDPDEHFEIMYYTALRWVVKQIKHENKGKSFLLANCIIGHTVSNLMKSSNLRNFLSEPQDATARSVIHGRHARIWPGFFALDRRTGGGSGVGGGWGGENAVLWRK